MAGASERDRIVTYSPSYTLVATHACFNRCTYCNFRVDLGQDPGLDGATAGRQLAGLAAQGISEVLILSGEVHPRHPGRPAWMERLVGLAQLALEQDLLPHTNAGPLTWAEMGQLRQVNVSLGLMLEQVTPALLTGVHRHAPSKRPDLRQQQLDWAGRWRIPFTTGLLLGIGETPKDWVDTLDAIAHSHRRWGHIQEVILQPYQPGHGQTAVLPPFPVDQLPEVVALARRLLPAEVVIQIPPNLIGRPDVLLACLEAGARDLGGIGLLDVINPDYPQPAVRQLKALLATGGWVLQPRLPLYPIHDTWLPSHLQARVQGWRKTMLSRADLQTSLPIG
ncbi:MAG: 7,8-didemethyl-8-hydroxy-5-deazariboflavin synthase subunit CofG [Gloeomargaritaceae cyanobacterium C42_A2020_066]|nr:7,8-didemethyl-8-hydroxy-5-deazariboflavin synthase subunit CofG [Gloeomargaritaceae cyanobacterium C42_A2020_066]